MADMEPNPNRDDDWALVLALGGPAKVVELLGWTKEGSIQRVQNWKHRGIPSKVKLKHPSIFLKGLMRQQARRKDSQQTAEAS